MRWEIHCFCFGFRVVGSCTEMYFKTKLCEGQSDEFCSFDEICLREGNKCSIKGVFVFVFRFQLTKMPVF